LREMGRVLEGRHFKAIEQEMARRLHSHLKWQFLWEIRCQEADNED
jgi:muconolactone delta-isomerase